MGGVSLCMILVCSTREERSKFVNVTINNPGPAKVGAISKAQK